MADAQIAIAVVSWNTRDLLDACLRSMHADAERGLAEVWVVDNGSTDGSRELVSEHHPWARLIRSGENLGYGAAVNRVAERTRARWIAPSNSDVRLEPGALDALLDAASAEPEAAAIGPRLILPGGATQPSVQPFPGLRTALIDASELWRLRRTPWWEPERAARVPWVTGAFLIVRRDAWDTVGGFDEAQWMYAEDLDLCWRITRAGWRVRYEPRAVVHHELSAAALAAFGAGMNERWQRATYAWMARRLGIATTWAAAGVELTSALLRWVVFSAIARRRPERWTERAARARAHMRVARFGLRPRRALLGVR